MDETLFEKGELADMKRIGFTQAELEAEAKVRARERTLLRWSVPVSVAGALVFVVLCLI